MTIYRLFEEPVFPDPAEADPDGLLAVGGDLSPERLLAAYAAGIFPWFGPNSPILWWSTNPRLILDPNDLHVPRRLERVLNQGRFAVTLDTAFGAVIRGCAKMKRPGQRGTWIVPEMVAAYERLHELGFAHSVEAWRDGKLAGGMYGVSLGRAFFGESMFHRETGASKAALVTLAWLLDSWGFTLLDCQQTTPHMLEFGAREVSRPEFLRRLKKALEFPTRQGRWELPASGSSDRPGDA